MFTKSFLNMVYANSVAQAVTSKKGILTIVNTSGQTRYAGYGNLSLPYDAANYYTISNSLGIKLGNGTTPPTENDYAPESLIASGLLSASTASAVLSVENDMVCRTVTISATNISSSDVTISEICNIANAGPTTTTNGGSISGSSGTYYLADRTLLDQPITIPPDETATITYKQKLALVVANS